MGKYLMLWELNESKIPVKVKDRGVATSFLLETVKQDMKKGLVKDWGVFVAENNGYAVSEGTEMDVINMMQQYNPFVRFKVHPIASVSHMDEMIKAMTK
jgi:hypothetical protein